MKKINDGVVHAAKIFPNSYLIMLIIGTLKGISSFIFDLLFKTTKWIIFWQATDPDSWKYWKNWWEERGLLLPWKCYVLHCEFHEIPFLFNNKTRVSFFSPTKASIVAALIFVLDKKTDWISAPHALVYFGISIFFVYFKVIDTTFAIECVINIVNF